MSDIESEELNDDVEIAAIEEVSELEAQIDTLDLNVDELSVDAEPEVIEEQNQDDNIADDLLDFNIDSSAVQSESPESHADVDIDDAGAETLEFDAPLSL
ncbi:MAG: hypothetical protein GQ548_05710, partial [Methylophaga sp.]|nr:hypothetical protein [Methylophaga sp.]